MFNMYPTGAQNLPFYSIYGQMFFTPGFPQGLLSCFLQGDSEEITQKISIYPTGAQELPDGFDPSIFMDSLYAELTAACPNGIHKCECLNAPGTFSEGPFDPKEEVIGSLLTYAGCGPGEYPVFEV